MLPFCRSDQTLTHIPSNVKWTSVPRSTMRDMLANGLFTFTTSKSKCVMHRLGNVALVVLVVDLWSGDLMHQCHVKSGPVVTACG